MMYEVFCFVVSAAFWAPILGFIIFMIAAKFGSAVTPRPAPIPLLGKFSSWSTLSITTPRDSSLRSASNCTLKFGILSAFIPFFVCPVITVILRAFGRMVSLYLSHVARHRQLGLAPSFLLLVMCCRSRSFTQLSVWGSPPRSRIFQVWLF